MADSSEENEPGVDGAGDLNPLDELKKRQKAELKSLQDEIIGRKKAINKTDKKKRKDLNAWIATEEAALTAKHEKELADFQSAGKQASTDTSVADVEEGVKSMEVQPRRVSKAEKRREKKSLQVKERDERIAEAEAERLDGLRSVEERTLAEILLRQGLKPHSIPPDGDCLFRAVSHQLSLTGEKTSVADLRKCAVRKLRADPDHFAPFVFGLSNEEDGNEDEIFLNYCDTMESTPAWGGHLELEALSDALGRPIEVVQATGPPLTFGDSPEGKSKLTIAYYRHAFGLGEHYESTEPVA